MKTEWITVKLRVYSLYKSRNLLMHTIMTLKLEIRVERHYFYQNLINYVSEYYFKRKN